METLLIGLIAQGAPLAAIIVTVIKNRKTLLN